MFRGHSAEHGHEPNFRWRGREVARIEGLCDGVFAFAITLLVVSLEVPHTYAELMHAMGGFFGFAISFAMLFQLWHTHNRFFRRYGLQDLTTHVLSAVLLFVVLFYTYPLKFLFGGLSAAVMGQGDFLMNVHEARGLMLVYGAGFVAVFTVLALLYGHALRQADALELTPKERLLTDQSFRANLLMAAVGVVSLGLSFGHNIAIAGFAYFLCPVVQTANGYWTRAKGHRLGVPPV